MKCHESFRKLKHVSETRVRRSRCSFLNDERILTGVFIFCLSQYQMLRNNFYFPLPFLLSAKDALEDEDDLGAWDGRSGLEMFHSRALPTILCQKEGVVPLGTCSCGRVPCCVFTASESKLGGLLCLLMTIPWLTEHHIPKALSKEF